MGIAMRDIRSLDLNLLKTLDALLEERNVTRAAARLGLTQPAVSAMLARLREAFEDPLFVRAQRGIVPTLRATAMAGAVKQVLGDIEGLLRPGAFDPATATFTLTLAATDYALQVIAVPYLSALRRQAPGIRVAVRPMDERPALALFEQGASQVIATATHGVLSGAAVDVLKNSRISEIVITNTLPVPQEKRFDKLTVLSIAPLLARAISEVFSDGSVTSLFDGQT